MFKGKNYLDSQDDELHQTDTPITFDWDQKDIMFKMKGPDGGYFSQRQSKILETYLDSIQRNKWVVMYHKSHCCIGTAAIVTGVLLFFTIILPILLVGVGIYILVEKEKYFEFVFQKMIVVFQNNEAYFKPLLVKEGIGSRLLYNKKQVFKGVRRKLEMKLVVENPEKGSNHLCKQEGKTRTPGYVKKRTQAPKKSERTRRDRRQGKGKSKKGGDKVFRGGGKFLSNTSPSTEYPCLQLSEEDKRIIMRSLFRKSRQVEENKYLFSSDIIEDTAKFEDMFVSIQ